MKINSWFILKGLLILLVVTSLIDLMVYRNQISTSKVSALRKLMAWSIVIFHDMFYTIAVLLMIYLVYLMRTTKMNEHSFRVLAILNAMLLIALICFKVFKMCILTLLFNFVLGIERCTLYEHGLIRLVQQHPIIPNLTCSINYKLWIESYILFTCFVLILNIYTLLQHLTI